MASRGGLLESQTVLTAALRANVACVTDDKKTDLPGNKASSDSKAEIRREARSREFSEKGINVVALVEPTGSPPKPGGLPAAEAKPAAPAETSTPATPSE